MEKVEKIGIFWDYENCCPPAGIPGYVVTEQIRKVAHHFGIITVFKAYLELSSTNVSPKTLNLRSELQSSGVSLTDCPRNGRKDVADKMIICDLLAFALDNPAPAVVMLISGDRDFNYAISILRHRRYTVILVIPPIGAHITLKSQANVVLDWKRDIFTAEAEEDKDNYDTAVTAVGHSLGANGTGVLTGTLSLGKGADATGSSTSLLPPVSDSSLNDKVSLSPPLTSSRPSSVAASSSSPIPAPLVTAAMRTRASSLSPETPMVLSPRQETPPPRDGGLPHFGVASPDPLSSSTPSIYTSPANRQSGGHRRRMSNLSTQSYRPVSPSKNISLPPGASPDELFATLIEVLEHWRLLGNTKPLRVQLNKELEKRNPWVYSSPYWSSFTEYTALAEKAGVVTLGEGGAAKLDWVQLQKKYQGKVFPIYI